MALPKRWQDPIGTIPKKIETFDDCRWMLPDESRILENGKPHGLIWMQPIEAEFLWDCVKRRPKGTNLAEIGRCEGGSTIIIGAAKDPDSTFVSVDIDPVDDPQLVSMLARLELRGIELEVGDSTTFEAGGIGNLGLLLIDGNHAYSAIMKDFDNWWPHLVPGGMCLMHDINPDGVGRGPWTAFQRISTREDVAVLDRKHTLQLIRKIPKRKFST